MEHRDYYVIYYFDNDEVEVVYSWDECNQKIKGRPNLKKKVANQEEAEEWLGGETIKKRRAQYRSGQLRKIHSRV